MPRHDHWAAARRLDYIDARLAILGEVNRSDLMRAFGVSMGQASVDIAAYVRLYPSAIRYDRQRKRYVATRSNQARRRNGPWADLMARYVRIETTHG